MKSASLGKGRTPDSLTCGVLYGRKGAQGVLVGKFRHRPALGPALAHAASLVCRGRSAERFRRLRSTGWSRNVAS